MSEPTTSATSPSEPVTGPVTTAAPAPHVHDEPARRSRVSTVAAWVGIVAGVVFIIAVIFFSGFVLGARSGGHHGGHHRGGGDRDFAIIHRGPPPGFPMGPRGQFERPGQSGPGGPGMQPPESPGAPGAPTTTAPATPRP